MYCLRCLYFVCWRNKIIIPSVITSLTFAMVLSFFYHNSVIYDKNEKYPHTSSETQHGFEPRQFIDVVKMVNEDTLDQSAQEYTIYNDVEVHQASPKKALLNQPCIMCGHQLSFKPDIEPVHRSRLYRNVKEPFPEVMLSWIANKVSFCEERFVGYHNEFAYLTDITFDLAFAKGRLGGENLSFVLNQNEEDEYITLLYGFAQMSCNKTPEYYFSGDNHANNQMLNSLRTHFTEKNTEPIIENKNFTIVIKRYEYVNFYHTMTDFYNAFLLMEFFNKTQKETNILIIDAHPKGSLDPVWPVLFNSVTRLASLPKRTHFTKMVWSIQGYNSPLLVDHYADTCPLIKEFREFFLSSFRLNEPKQLNCDKLDIMFIWRHDYVAHPRNPTGKISRKISNERELVSSLKKKYPTFNVHGHQVDLYPMYNQLKLITQADILIGMHGAGLTHALFLQNHAALIEYQPFFADNEGDHFLAIARWRNIFYDQYKNDDPALEDPNRLSTNILIDVLLEMVRKQISNICTVDKTRNEELLTGYNNESAQKLNV